MALAARRIADGVLLLYLAGCFDKKVKPKKRRYRFTLQERRNRSGKIRRKSLKSPKDSDWVTMYRSGEDDAMICVTGFDHKTFSKLLALFKPWFDKNTPIKVTGEIGPRNPRSFGGRPRSMSASTGLALVLAYYRSKGPLRELQFIFGLTYTVVSLWLRFGRRLLLKILLKHPDAAVVMPTDDEVRTFRRAINRKYPALSRVWGALDGLKMPIQRPLGYADQNRYYNGHTHDHYVTNLFLFTPDGKIRFSYTNAPGSYHDSTMATSSGFYDKMAVIHERNKCFIVADDAFATNARGGIIVAQRTVKCSVRGVRCYKYKKTIRVAATAVRQFSEWGMRGLKCSFPRLSERIHFEKRGERRIIITLGIRLYNFRAHHVGQNQIQSVFMPLFGKDFNSLAVSLR